MAKWEYKIEFLSGRCPQELVDILNSYGKEGWEVCGIDAFHDSDEILENRIFFKRKNRRLIMKYYVYITNCSNRNHMYEYDNLEDAKRHCKDASEHCTCTLIKGTKIKWK